MYLYKERLLMFGHEKVFLSFKARDKRLQIMMYSKTYLDRRQFGTIALV